MGEGRRSALAHLLPWEAPDGSVTLAEAPFLRQIGVRRRGRASAYLAGLPVPLEPNRVAVMGLVRVLWLGPDELLVTAPDEAVGGLMQRLARIEGNGLADLSSSRAGIEISGPGRARFSKRAAGSICTPRIRARPLRPDPARARAGDRRAADGGAELSRASCAAPLRRGCAAG